MLQLEAAGTGSDAGSDGGWDSYSVGDVAGWLGRLAAWGFPVVVFADDVHDAGPSLLDLVDRLLGRGGSLLVVSTCRPDRMGDRPDLEELMAVHGDCLVRVGDHVAAGCRFPEGAGLGVLEAEARGELLH